MKYTLKGYYEKYRKKTINNFAKFKIEGSKRTLI